MVTVIHPRMEDYERLALRWIDSAQKEYRDSHLMQALDFFPNMYNKNRDGIPQTDSDRAFWLVCQAAEILDKSIYETDDNAVILDLTATATTYLDEALQLDPHCYDAVRMRQILDIESHADYIEWLKSMSDEVKESCESIVKEAGMLPPDHMMGLSVFMRPYLRWLLNIAYEYYMCGHYRLALETCTLIMDLDNHDCLGARLLAAYVYVKLEDAEGLAGLIHMFNHEENAWFLLARCCMAYKQRRLEDAEQLLRELAFSCDLGGNILMRQEEIPPALFGYHLVCAPGTSDELFVAVSEAAVILAENGGDYLSPMGSWIAMNPVIAELASTNESEGTA